MMNQPASDPSRKVLVIDDNPIIQRTIYFALRDRGCTVSLAGGITEALKLVREQHPDVILLDLNFPADGAIGSTALRDGFWALDWLQHMDEARNVPVIIISSDPPEKSRARALASGAVAYFQKPLDKQELAAAVAALPAPKSAPVAS